MVEFLGNGAYSLIRVDPMANEHQMADLIEATRDNGAKMDSLCHKIETLSIQHKDMIRWLLMVVCVIALGSKAMEMVDSLWGKRMSSTNFETVKP